MDSENKLVYYTHNQKTIHGMLVSVGSCKYILHNEKGFPGNSTIRYDPWIKEFGKTYKYYLSGIIMKNVSVGEEIHELW